MDTPDIDPRSDLLTLQAFCKETVRVISRTINAADTANRYPSSVASAGYYDKMVSELHAEEARLLIKLQERAERRAR